MEDNFEGVLKTEWYREDLKILTSQLSEQESLLRLKRRWLMDLPLSVREQKRIEKILPPNDKMMPESLLREDDVSYDDIRNFIEKGFGAHDCGNNFARVQKDVQIFNSRDGFRDIFILLNEMNNKGLHSLMEILTGGLIEYDKTNWRMKKAIRGLLPKVISEKNDISEAKVQQLSRLLEDPQNFTGNQTTCSNASEAYCADAKKVLDGLEDFPFRTLIAMHRKLRGVEGYIPCIEPQKCGRSRDKLISLIRKLSMEMLSGLREVDEPAEPLSGALGVAGLTLKFIMNHSAIRDFRKFSPEIEALQNDIAKAISLLHDTTKVSLIELKKVQHLVDPDSQMSVRSLRQRVRHLLTEFLFECDDLDKIPDYIVQTVDIINRRSRLPSRKKNSCSKIQSSPKELMKDTIQKEVEYLLSITAQAKEVVLDSLPSYEFDEDFTHAYIEDFEGSETLSTSDDDDYNEQFVDRPQHFDFQSYSMYCHSESVGETIPAESRSSVKTSEGDDSYLSPDGMLYTPLQSMHITDIDSKGTSGFVQPLSCKEENAIGGRCPTSKQYSASLEIGMKQNVSTLSSSPARDFTPNHCKQEDVSGFPVNEADIFNQQRKRNQYLQIQEVCDATSMVAYRFTGHVLAKFAEMENIELYRGDILYLQSYSLVSKDSKETLLTSDFAKIWTSLVQE